MTGSATELASSTAHCRNVSGGKSSGPTLRPPPDFAVLGGWECVDGTPPARARWFSLRLDRSSAPELFTKDTAQKTVATWELLATLLCIELFVPADAPGTGTVGTCQLSGGTDNQGNSYIVSRLLTSKFPLCAVLMQLATVLEMRRTWLDLYWLPRERNVEADALTNDDFVGFDPARRLHVPWPHPAFVLLRRVCAEGAAIKY